MPTAAVPKERTNAKTYADAKIFVLKTSRSGNIQTHLNSNVSLNVTITELPKKDKSGKFVQEDGKLNFYVRDTNPHVRDRHESTIRVSVDANSPFSKTLEGLSKGKTVVVKGTLEEDSYWGITAEPYIEADEVSPA